MLMIVHPLGMMTHLFPSLGLIARSDKEKSECGDWFKKRRKRPTKTQERYGNATNSLVKEKIMEQVKKEVPAQVLRSRFPCVLAEDLSGQARKEPGPSTSGNQEQDDEFDFWTDSYASDDDEIPTKQMKNFLQSDIVRKAKGKFLFSSFHLSSSHPRKITPLVQSCQRDPEAPALSLINQDLLYLKKGNSGPEKIVLYGVENWKNPHAKICPTKRRQKEPEDQRKRSYSNSKIVQVIKTYWELGHEHKFITEIVARRANDCIVSITEPDYKNLNKNDIKDMYLLIVNNKVPDYANTRLLWSLSVFIRSSVIWERVHDFQLGIESYQQKINLTAPTITFPRIEEYDVFSIVYEPVHGIIYTNSKKEKKGLKSYNNDVKYGYVQKELTNDEVEFLKLFEEEIEVRLNFRDQMRRWEIFEFSLYLLSFSEQDDVYNNSEDPLASAMLLLAKAITQNFSNPTNNRLRASSNTRNQAVVQGDRVNIQSRNFGNVGRNNRRAYVQGEVVEGMNATNETANVQRNCVESPDSSNTSTVNAITLRWKGQYARIVLSQSYQNFLIDEPAMKSPFTIDDDQINSNIQFDFVKGNVNSGSVEKDTHVYDQYALETLVECL
ncbi:hypothetical protein Tco_0313565 [Tanacetum coccineum]